MVNIEKYKNDGWGISKLGFEKILKLIREKNIGENYNIVEFGSGISTKFLVDLNLDEFNNFNITSFDDNIDYAFNGKYDFLNVHIKELLECDDKIFNSFLMKKEINDSLLRFKATPLSTRQKNNFYNITDELTNIYDLVILDGPNGNGRSLSFIYLINHIKRGTIFFIDDFKDYDFDKTFLNIYPNARELFRSESGKLNQWNNGGDFIIFEI